jgi:hypothetical protein
MILEKDSQDFSDNLKILSILYKEIKEVVLLAEIVNDERAVLLTSVNEMRNAFDHIMRCYLDDSDYKKHIDKARGHLYRAGYDAYELMAIDIFLEIKERLNERSSLAISLTLPEYYEVLVPRMKELEILLMDARANKKPDSHKSATLDDISKITEEEFKEYGDIVSELIKIKEKVMKALPAIILKEEEEKKIAIEEQNTNAELEKFTSENKTRTRVTIALGAISILAAIVSLWMD